MSAALPRRRTALSPATIDVGPMTLVEAERRREIALARLRQGDLSTQQALWLARPLAQRTWRKVRANIALLAARIPNEIAAQAPGKSTSLIAQVIRDAVYLVLTEVAQAPVHAEPIDPSKAPQPLEPSVSDEATLTEAKAAKLAATAQIRELQVLIRTGELVETAEMEARWIRAIMTWRTRLLSMEGLAPRLHGRDTAGIERIVGRAVRDAVAELPEETF
jgi:hypothetical protein